MGEFNATQYENDYQKEKYDRIIVNVPKGQREIIQAYAKAKGQSMNACIVELLRHNIPGLQEL